MSELRIRDRLQLLNGTKIIEGLTNVKRVKTLLKSGQGVQRKLGSCCKEKLQMRDKQRVAGLAKEHPKRRSGQKKITAGIEMDHRELPKEGQLSQSCTNSEANFNRQTEGYATGLVFGEQGYRLGHLLR